MRLHQAQHRRGDGQLRLRSARRGALDAREDLVQDGRSVGEWVEQTSLGVTVHDRGEVHLQMPKASERDAGQETQRQRVSMEAGKATGMRCSATKVR